MKKLLHNTTLLIFLLLLSTHCTGQKTNDKYFVTSSGSRIEFAMLYHLVEDTLYIYNADNERTFVKLNEIEEYNIIRPKGRAWRGLLTGALAGGLLGAMVGSSYFGNDVSGIAASASLAAIPTGLIGTLIGALSKSEKKTNFSNRTLEEKQQFFREEIHFQRTGL